MIYILTVGGVFLLDYLLKQHVDSTRLQGSKKEVFGKRLLLRNCHNEGSMLGIMHLGKEECKEMSALALGGVLWEFFRQIFRGGSKLAKFGLSMVLGGGASNYLDRCTKGYVTDYVSLNVDNKKVSRIVFNLSDLFILYGSILWLVGTVFGQGKKKKS